MKKQFFTLLTLLCTIVGGATSAWTTDFVDTYGAFNSVTGSYVGTGISKIALGENASANSGIQATSEGATLKFTVSTPTGFTIKSIVFKGSNAGTISCNDDGGTLSTTSGTTTLTASTDKTSVEFTVASSASNKKAKLTDFVVTVSSSTTDDYELITPASISDGNINYSSSLGDDKLVTAMAGIGGPSVGASDISFGNAKGFSITTSRAIKSVYCVWYQRAPINNSGWTGYSEAACTNSIGTYSTTTNAWVAPNDNTQFVAFKSTEGSTHKLSSIHIFYYNSTEPTISASTVLITEDATDAGEISYTVDAKGTSGTVTASTAADWITLGAVDEVNNKVPFTATANTANVSRSATVTLTYTYNTSETVTKDVTVTQGADVKGGGSFITVTLNGGTSATVTGTIGGTADVNVQSDKKFGSGHYAGFTLAGGNTFHTGDIINVNIATASSGGGSTIAIYDTDKSTILYNTGTIGVVGDNKFVLPAACNGKSTLYICRTSSNGWNAVVNFIEVSRPASGTISASGWNTFSCSYALDLSTITNGTAYVATATSGNIVTLTPTTAKVAAGTGLMIKGTSGQTFTIAHADGEATLTGDNLLVGLPSGGTVAKNNNYVFGWATASDPGFYLVNDTEPVLGAGKAYLHTESALGARLAFNFNEDVTAINSAKSQKQIDNGQYYDLQGRKVAQPTKGLYIINGKKVIVK